MPVSLSRRRTARARAILFDLDDTLYPYRAFVRSGFRAVALRLAAERGLSARTVLRVLRRALSGGARGRELQALCERFALPVSLVPVFADVIRHHTPAIGLPRDSQDVLAALRGSWRTAIVTNGAPDVQRRKVEALRLDRQVDAVVYATEHGDGRGKPASPAFEAALDRLGVRAADAVFVGDDRSADIDGATAVGMHTIHHLGYRHGHVCDERGCGAHVHRIAQVPAVADRLVSRRA